MSTDTPSGQAQHVHMPASFLAKTAQDPAQGWPHAPRDFGRDVIPHVFSVGARLGTISNTYPWYDEALKDSPNNAEIMRTETGVMECLEARQRGSALCRWHIEARDSKSQAAVDLAGKVSAIVEETPYFVDLRRCLLEALWYGRYLTTHRIGSQNIDGQPRQYIKHWTPRHGDKIAFRFDDGSGEYSDDQIGLRVAATWTELRKQVDFRGQRIDKVQPTQQGLVYWFDDRDRERTALHRHLVEDGAFQDPRAIGRINGVGIRDRIYWAWYGMQECMTNALNFIERNAHGIEIWRYPAGNKEAHDKTVEAAENRSNKSVLLVPVQPGELADLQSVEVVEPGFAGLDALMGIVQNYYGHKIKRYILGQVLTSEAAATGLGSGVADAHLATFADIVRYDAFKLEETITKDIVRPLQLFNFPKSYHIKLRFRLDTESEDMESKLAAWERAWNIGARIPESDLMSIIGARMPNEDDRTLENPQLAQAEQQMQMQEQQMRMQEQQMAQGAMGAMGPGGGTNPQAGEPGGRREPSPESVFPPMGEAGAQLAEMQQASQAGQPDRYSGERSSGYSADDLLLAGIRHEMDRGLSQREARRLAHRNLRRDPSYYRMLVADLWRMELEETDDIITPGDKTRYGVEWDESKHQRDEDGKFAEKGRASGSRGEPRFAIRDELEPGQWTGGAPQRGGNGKARFTIGEDTYTFKAIPFHNHPEIPINMDDLSGHSVSFQHEQSGHSPSGVGNARAVFRHVLGAVLDMIHQGADILIFSGATPQHEKLYHNMMRLYAKHLPEGYSCLRADITDGTSIFGIVSARASERIEQLLADGGETDRPASRPVAANMLADLEDDVPELMDVEDYYDDAIEARLEFGSGAPEITVASARDMAQRWVALGEHVEEHGWDVPMPGIGKDPREAFEELVDVADHATEILSDDGLIGFATEMANQWSDLAEAMPRVDEAYQFTQRHLDRARRAMQRGQYDVALERLRDASGYAAEFSESEWRGIDHVRRRIEGIREDMARGGGSASDLEMVHQYTLDGQPERYVARGEWDESLHPRDEEGKFVEKGQGRGGRAASTPGADRRLAETLAEQGILSGATIRSHEKGMRVTIPGHGHFDVRTVPQETLQKMAARHAEQARKSARAGGHEIVGEVGGVYGNGRLILADDFTDGELNHEIVHALQDMGVITSKEINLFGGREGMAYAYQQWVRDGEPPNSIFQRVKDFLMAIFRPREYRKQQALRKLDRGEALEDVRRHEEAATSFAARAAELGAPVDGDPQERNSTPIMDPDDPWTGISDDGGINVARVLFATRDPDQWLQKAKKDPGIRRLYGAGELDRIAGQMRGTAKIINGLRARLPWDEEKGNPIRGNTDELFGETFDVTTVCPKQELYVDVIRNLQKRHRRLFDKKERFLIGRMMQEVGMGPACWYCYGQQSRDNAAQTSRNAAELFQSVAEKHDSNELKDLLANPDDPQTEARLKKLWEPSSPTSNPWSFRNNNPRSDQYGQPSRFAAYAYQYAGDPEARRLWKNKPHRVYDLAMGYGKLPRNQLEADTKKAVRAAMPSANDPKGWASYTGHALRMDPQRIQKYNQSAGFRMNSQADFSPWHTVEVSQFLTDLGARKGQAHAYTRVPEFVDIFGDTGVKFNLSCGYATDKRTGELQRDATGPIWDMDSFPREKALEARQSNPNAGTMLVPLNTKQLLTGLNDPNIDMMIPYHAGAVPSEVTREQHAENFEAWQHEDYSNSTLPGKPPGAPRGAKPPSVRVTLSNGKKVKIHRGQQITREHHDGSKAQYLELCDTLKITPRFPQLCGRGEQAKSVPNHPLSGVNTDHPNYMKLVKDVARDDTPQKAVDGRRVNWDAANRHLRTFARQQPARRMQGHNNELLKILSRRIQRGEWPRRADPSTGEPVIQLEGRGRRSRRDQQSEPGAATRRYAAETPEQTVARYRRIAEHAWAEPTSAV